MKVNIVSLGSLIQPAPNLRAGDRQDLPILSMTMKEGLIDQSSKFKKRIASTDLSPYKVVKRGQLVVGFPIDEGVLSIQSIYEEALVSPAYGVWDISLEKVDEKYLEFFLRSDVAINFYLAKLRGSTARRRSLPAKTFLNLEVPLPSMNQQREFVSLLREASEIKTKAIRSVSYLEELTGSLFSGFLSTNHFPLVKLSEITTKITDGTHRSPKTVESGVPYLTAKHVKKGKLVFEDNPWFISELDHAEIYSRCDAKPGDVLYIKDGATTGIAAVNLYDFEFSLLSSVALIRPNLDLVRPDFLVSFLNDEGVKSQLLLGMSGAAIKRFTLAKIKEFMIPLPPMSEQIKLSALLNTISGIKQSFDSQVQLGEELFSSIQNRAFSSKM